jgi:pyruvate ferredoxin oxidoreductase alpha subunit
MFGRTYQGVESYRMEDAELGMLVSGSIASTAIDAVDELRAAGIKVGIISQHLFRPIPPKMVAAAKRAEELCVVDRNIGFGVGGIFCQEARQRSSAGQHPGVNMIVGLGGRVTGNDIVEMAKLALKPGVPSLHGGG